MHPTLRPKWRSVSQLETTLPKVSETSSHMSPIRCLTCVFCTITIFRCSMRLHWPVKKLLFEIGLWFQDFEAKFEDLGSLQVSKLDFRALETVPSASTKASSELTIFPRLLSDIPSYSTSPRFQDTNMLRRMASTLIFYRFEIDLYNCNFLSTNGWVSAQKHPSYTVLDF